MSEKCGNCKFFKGYEEAYYQDVCRRYPRSNTTETSFDDGYGNRGHENAHNVSYSRYAEAHEDDWCGEFKPLPKPPQK